MPSSQPQTRPRFAPLYADTSYDPAGGNLQPINRLFCVTGTTSDSTPAHIQSRVTAATNQGRGIVSLLLLTDNQNGCVSHFFFPHPHLPGLISTGSRYENKLIAIDGDLYGDNMGYSAVVLPGDVFHKTKPVLTYTPTMMASYFADNPTATGVGPFTAEDASAEDMEKVQSRNCTWQPFGLGVEMSPSEGLTANYFWVHIYPGMVRENKTDDYAFLIQYFQLVATLDSEGGRSVVERSAPPPVGRDVGVHENITTQILGRLFPKPPIDAYSGDGLKAVARELGKMSYKQQERDEAAEEARRAREASQHSLEKQLGKQPLLRIMKYNGVRDEDELRGSDIPFIQALVNCKSKKENDVLECLQEAVSEVYDRDLVDEGDRIAVTAQMLKAILCPWERADPDNLGSGVGSNCFLHGPRDANKALASVGKFKDTLHASMAPSASVLKELRTGEIFLPTLEDVGYTLRSMKRFMEAVLRPNHPFIESLGQVLNKWVETERKFTQNARADNDPARGIMLLEALNMEMSEYWQTQKHVSGDLIPGFDGLRIFRAIDGKRQWRPEISATYRQTLKLDAFEGVYGGHKFITDCDTATVVVSSTTQGSARGGTPKRAPEEDSNRTGSGKENTMAPNKKFNTELFGRYKSRKDPATGSEYRAKEVRDKCETPLPISKTGYVWTDRQGQTHKGRMCLAYHVKGMCNSSCPCKEDHVEYSVEGYKELVKWCDDCYPGSDE